MQSLQHLVLNNDANLKTLFDSNSSKVLNGIGVFAKYNLFGKVIYSSKLPFREANRRLLSFYFPYHKKIRQIIRKIKSIYNKMLALDCHSMAADLVDNKTDIVSISINFN